MIIDKQDKGPIIFVRFTEGCNLKSQLKITTSGVNYLYQNGSNFMWYCLIYYALKVVLTFKSVDETLVCDHSSESY